MYIIIHEKNAMGKCRSFMVFVSDLLRKMWYVIEVLNPRKYPQKKKRRQVASNCYDLKTFRKVCRKESGYEKS